MCVDRFVKIGASNVILVMVHLLQFVKMKLVLNVLHAKKSILTQTKQQTDSVNAHFLARTHVGAEMFGQKY